MKQLIHTFNISKHPAFQAAAALTTDVMTISRLNYKPDLMQITSLYPLPAMPRQFTKTFEDISLQRAQDLWVECALYQNINILWSGGIDSTLALVALILTLPNKFNITVYCNFSSINENERFYKLLLANKSVILKNSSVLTETVPTQFVTGDLGDQIFGSELLFRIDREFGFENLKKPFQQIIPKLFNSRCGSELGSVLYDRYLPIINECPFPLKSAFDFIWWWNYTQKWQGVKLRKQCYLKNDMKLFHFFDSSDFELWSVFNHELKIGSVIESYKKSAKDFIFKYDNNEFYLNFKKKCSSPFGGKVYYFAHYDDGSKIFSWSECQKEIESRSLL
ncbi:MAG: hypothetical protein WA160_05585 [Pseudobdellovibrio sp.]